MAGKLQTHELLAWFSSPFSASHMSSPPLLNLSHAAHLEKKKWKYRYGT